VSEPDDPRLPAGLAATDLDALNRNGFVAVEARESGRTIFTLRWRTAGRQRSRRLGSDPAVADAVRAALADLRDRREQERELFRRARMIHREARLLQLQLAAVLAEQGRHFHGRRVRRRRSCPDPSSVTHFSRREA
jgi:hypothetical protein